MLLVGLPQGLLLPRFGPSNARTLREEGAPPPLAAQEEAPLIDALVEASNSVRAPFFFPGHKMGADTPRVLRNRLLHGTRPLQYDLPELPEIDGLFAADGPIARAQALAAEAFGAARTWYLVNGSTAGVIAAVLACVQLARQRGVAAPAVLLPRNAPVGGRGADRVGRGARLAAAGVRCGERAERRRARRRGARRDRPRRAGVGRRRPPRVADVPRRALRRGGRGGGVRGVRRAAHRRRGARRAPRLPRPGVHGDDRRRHGARERRARGGAVDAQDAGLAHAIGDGARERRRRRALAAPRARARHRPRAAAVVVALRPPPRLARRRALERRRALRRWAAVAPAAPPPSRRACAPPSSARARRAACGSGNRAPAPAGVAATDPLRLTLLTGGGGGGALESGFALDDALIERGVYAELPEAGSLTFALSAGTRRRHAAAARRAPRRARRRAAERRGGEAAAAAAAVAGAGWRCGARRDDAPREISSSRRRRWPSRRPRGA